MPWTELNIKKEIDHQRETDEEFKKAWDDSRAEYKLVAESNRLQNRKKGKRIKI